MFVKLCDHACSNVVEDPAARGVSIVTDIWYDDAMQVLAGLVVNKQHEVLL